MAIASEPIDSRKVEFIENLKHMLAGSKIENFVVTYNFQDIQISRPRGKFESFTTDVFHFIIKKENKKYKIAFDVIQSQFEEIKEDDAL